MQRDRCGIGYAFQVRPATHRKALHPCPHWADLNRVKALCTASCVTIFAQALVAKQIDVHVKRFTPVRRQHVSHESIDTCISLPSLGVNSRRRWRVACVCPVPNARLAPKAWTGMGKSQTCSMSILCALEIEYRQLPRHREDDRIKG